MGEVIHQPPLVDRDPDSPEGGVTSLRPCNLSARGHAAISGLDTEMQVWFKLPGHGSAVWLDPPVVLPLSQLTFAARVELNFCSCGVGASERLSQDQHLCSCFFWPGRPIGRLWLCRLEGAPAFGHWMETQHCRESLVWLWIPCPELELAS